MPPGRSLSSGTRAGTRCVGHHRARRCWRGAMASLSCARPCAVQNLASLGCRGSPCSPASRLKPPLATTLGMVGMAAATPAPPVRRHRRRRLVPGADQLRQSEEALATAKVFLAAVAKDGAAVVRTKGSEAAARCVLQLLEAERHALMLVLLRQRPPHLPSRFPLPPVGGDASDVQLVERSMLASVTLTREADDACRKLERAMAEAPPQYLQQLGDGGGGGIGGGAGQSATRRRTIVCSGRTMARNSRAPSSRTPRRSSWCNPKRLGSPLLGRALPQLRRRRCEALRVALSTARLGQHASEELSLIHI